MLENLKTVLLLSILSVILIIIFGFIGRAFGIGNLGLLIGLIFSLVMTFVSYFKSDEIALRSNHAQVVSEQEAPNLHRIIRELTNSAGLKMPRVAVIRNKDPNAFATGRNQDHAAVAVTTGLLELLTEDELRGVLSHELGHIKNRDILISSVAACIASFITYAASMARFAAVFGGGNNRDGYDLIGGLIIMILGPISAAIIQLAISRTREYKADATGAEICGNPLALASALRKIEFGVQQHPMTEAKATDAHMFIMNPFGNAMDTMQKLFSTHPPTAERILRLEEMAGRKLEY
ncbi:MAG: zinc metalloprotease HtpX [Methanosphaera sp.]|nr:zinc metalloprotease HtpX [Methanosphaera sp.]